jgi:hypothetical protein
MCYRYLTGDKYLVELVLNIKRQKVSQKPIGYINTDFGKKRDQKAT